MVPVDVVPDFDHSLLVRSPRHGQRTGEHPMLNAFALPESFALCDSGIRAPMLHELVSEFQNAFAGMPFCLDVRFLCLGPKPARYLEET
jgi:hypothetical protein